MTEDLNGDDCQKIGCENVTVQLTVQYEKREKKMTDLQRPTITQTPDR